MNGVCDCVVATRFALGGRYVGGVGHRWLVSRFGGLLARLLLRLPLSDPTSGFQLFSRPALTRVRDPGIRSKGPFFQTEIKHGMRDFRFCEVPITYVPTAQRVRPAALGDALRMLLAMWFQRWS